MALERFDNNRLSICSRGSGWVWGSRADLALSGENSEGAARDQICRDASSLQHLRPPNFQPNDYSVIAESSRVPPLWLQAEGCIDLRTKSAIKQIKYLSLLHFCRREALTQDVSALPQLAHLGSCRSNNRIW